MPAGVACYAQHMERRDGRNRWWMLTGDLRRCREVSVNRQRLQRTESGMVRGNPRGQGVVQVPCVQLVCVVVVVRARAAVLCLPCLRDTF